MLLDAGNAYSAAALTRQLVEVEYLAWAFVNNETEAASWLRAEPDDRKKNWNAGPLLRKANGKFRGEAYMHHCEMGGHPTPRGGELIFSPDSEAPAAHWWFEAAVHGVGTWDYMKQASQAGRSYFESLIEHNDSQQLEESIQAWRHSDPAIEQIRTIKRAKTSVSAPRE